MDKHEGLAQRFEAERGRLRGVAYRMLGSLGEAEDAVQEAWLRLGRADSGGIDNLEGWLTTVVARVCLDMLRSRKSRGEQPLDGEAPGADRGHAPDPEEELLLADSVGLALLVVLDTLEPAERLAFVLHDLFDLSFDEIAPIVGRSTAAARQLASRARGRLRGARLRARSGRRLPARPGGAARRPDCGSARGSGRGEALLGTRAGGASRARERRGGRDRGAARSAVPRARAENQRREDLRGRGDRRPGAPPAARPRGTGWVTGRRARRLVTPASLRTPSYTRRRRRSAFRTARAQCVDRLVADDVDQPRHRARHRGIEPARAVPHIHESLLQHLFGAFPVIQYTESNPQQMRAGGAIHLLEP